MISRTFLLLTIVIALGALVADYPVAESTSDPVVSVDTDTSGNGANTVGTIEICRQVANDATFYVDITIQSVSNLAGFEQDLLYNPSVLSVMGVDYDYFLLPPPPNWLLTLGDIPPDTDGVFSMGAAQFPVPTGASGPGVLARLTLQAVGDGTSILDLTNVKLADINSDPVQPADSQGIYLGHADDAVIYVGSSCPPDLDSDTILNAADNCPLAANASQTDTDSDGMGDACDPDDDNDTVPDGTDADSLDQYVCQDVDADTCDDCSVLGQPDTSNDGTDTDSDGACDAGDPDDDNDGLPDTWEDSYACTDTLIADASDDDDTDGLTHVQEYAASTDPCNDDTDSDTVPDGTDADPLDQYVCQDLDFDTCDDCAVLGTPDPSDDGTDTDADGLCDAGDPDDDNDTVLDGADADPLDQYVCQDLDSDTCDDCAVLGTPDPSDDGTDTDSDGACNAGDPDDDNDTVLDGADADPLDQYVCQDLDTDTCDDCSVLGQPDVSQDGTDSDSDGACDLGDPDDDNDTVADGSDNCPLVYNPDQADSNGDGIGDACTLVGGIAQYPDVAQDSVDRADLSDGGSDSWARDYGALAGGLAVAVSALAAGAWYVRRRPDGP